MSSRDQGGNEIRTELGNEIATEKPRAAKDGGNVPRYRTTPRRTIRDNRRAVGQGVKSTLELRTKDVAESALANTAGRRREIVGDWGVARHTLPVGAARGNRTKVTEERSMGGEELSESVVSSDLLVSRRSP